MRLLTTKPSTQEIYQNAGQALRQWLTTQEGSSIWQNICPRLLPEKICCALSNTSENRFGLLLTNYGAAILSRFSTHSFARLAPRYKRAAETGLCFWWENHMLIQIEGRELIVLIQALPCPRPRLFRRSHKGHHDTQQAASAF